MQRGGAVGSRVGAARGTGSTSRVSAGSASRGVGNTRIAVTRADLATHKSVQSTIRAALKQRGARPTDLVREWDFDKSGEVSRAEFRNGLAGLGFTDDKKGVDALFDAWDADGNGTLDYVELEKALRSDETLDDAKEAKAQALQAGGSKVARGNGQAQGQVFLFSQKQKQERSEARSTDGIAREERRRVDEKARLHLAELGETLRSASATGDLAELKRIIQAAKEKDQEAAVLEHGNVEGVTALMKAAMYGHEDAVRVLLFAGAGVDSQDRKGRTALMLGALNGHLAVLRSLLEGGAAVGSLDSRDRSAFMHAAAHGHVEALRLLGVAMKKHLLRHGGPKEWLLAPDAGGMTARMLADANEMEEASRALEQMEEEEAACATREAERAAAERLEAERKELERKRRQEEEAAAAKQAATEKAAAAKRAAAEKAAAEKVAAEKVAAEKAAAEAAEKAVAEKAGNQGPGSKWAGLREMRRSSRDVTAEVITVPPAATVARQSVPRQRGWAGMLMSAVGDAVMSAAGHGPERLAAGKRGVSVTQPDHAHVAPEKPSGGWKALRKSRRLSAEGAALKTPANAPAAPSAAPAAPAATIRPAADRSFEKASVHFDETCAKGDAGAAQQDSFNACSFNGSSFNGGSCSDGSSVRGDSSVAKAGESFRKSLAMTTTWARNLLRASQSAIESAAPFVGGRSGGQALRSPKAPKSKKRTASANDAARGSSSGGAAAGNSVLLAAGALAAAAEASSEYEGGACRTSALSSVLSLAGAQDATTNPTRALQRPDDDDLLLNA